MQIKDLIVDNQISAKTLFLDKNYVLSAENKTIKINIPETNENYQLIHNGNWNDLMPVASAETSGLMDISDKKKLDNISTFLNQTDKHELTNQEKLNLFLEAFSVDKYPEEIEGFNYVPYFDKKKMKFSWKPIYNPEA